MSSPKFSPDPHVEAVRRKLLDRSVRGKEKYGGTTWQNLATMIEQLEHLQQELMDAAVYCEWAMQRCRGHHADMLAEAYREVADAIGFPADKQRFRHHVRGHAESVASAAARKDAT